jgi:hypothetical protein
MKLGITICATKQYAYALGMQAQAVCNSIREYKRAGYDTLESVKVIIVGSQNDFKLDRIAKFYINQIGAEVEIIKVEDSDQNKNYKTDAQLLIAKLRSLAFNAAKRADVTHCWSLDSDVIPKANSLYCMRHALDFDVDYYQVASCVYPSQGGGLFLCGRGTPKRQISEDIYPDEKDVPEKVLNRIAELEKKVEELQNTPREAMTPEIYKAGMLLARKRRFWAKYVDKKCKALTANVFELNAKKWRKRGWFDFAYPAIGKGAVVPTDWMGFGCALIGAKALNLIDFSGYEGAGTEDLFIIWNRWYPNNVRIAAIPHCPGDHIIRTPNEKGVMEYVHIFTYHETGGEFVGHLRQDRKKFKEFEV